MPEVGILFLIRIEICNGYKLQAFVLMPEVGILFLILEECWSARR